MWVTGVLGAGSALWFGFGGGAVGGFDGGFYGWSGVEWGRVDVSPDLEDRRPDGSRYTPSTQSFLRGEHCLEKLTAASVELDGADLGRLRFEHPEIEFEVVDLPFDQLVPRLHYKPPGNPDAFDALNLMLAEYSRNGVSVPAGKAGDTMAHFETDLEEERPYRVEADYQFAANERFRPVRFAVINNCLKPGLWEISASDRSGEIHHSWMTMPDAVYHQLVARSNGLSEEFVRDALAWRADAVELDLDRLRRAPQPLGSVVAELLTGSKSGYSSQGSRRKLAAGFALVERGAERVMPKSLADLTATPVHLSSFVEPGKYSMNERRRFDFGFLRGIREARVMRTTAITDYNWRHNVNPSHPDCVEIHLDLGEWTIILGNLPIKLLVPQEDLGIWGFGVGVLPSSDFAERRKFLIEDGPPPSFAYLCRKKDGKHVVVNSHDFGLEQVFIRTNSTTPAPWWEITLTSYERIVDIVKYRVVVPSSMAAELKDAAANYAAPLYRTYRDDNLR
jgi:hypothetical protein